MNISIVKLISSGVCVEFCTSESLKLISSGVCAEFRTSERLRIDWFKENSRSFVPLKTLISDELPFLLVYKLWRDIIEIDIYWHSFTSREPRKYFKLKFTESFFWTCKIILVTPKVEISKEQWRTVQESTEQWRTVQVSTEHWRTVKNSTERWRTVQDNTVEDRTEQRKTRFTVTQIPVHQLIHIQSQRMIIRGFFVPTSWKGVHSLRSEGGKKWWVFSNDQKTLPPLSPHPLLSLKVPLNSC